MELELEDYKMAWGSLAESKSTGKYTDEYSLLGKKFDLNPESVLQ